MKAAAIDDVLKLADEFEVEDLQAIRDYMMVEASVYQSYTKRLKNKDSFEFRLHEHTIEALKNAYKGKELIGDDHEYY